MIAMATIFGRTRQLAPLLLGVVALPLACSGGGNVNLGNTQTLGNNLSDYAAHWDGYAEAYTFYPSGSDRVRLVLDASGAGTLQFGDTTLPPPTDPNVGYPQGIYGVNDLNNPWEGFAYPVHATRVTIGRLQLGINPYDLFAGWCALQTPVAFVEPASQPDAAVSTYTRYMCSPKPGPEVPDAGCASGIPDGGGQLVDCGAQFLCGQQVCTCTNSGCTTPPSPADLTPAQYPVDLDAALDGSAAKLTGTLVVGQMRVTVHLVRQ